MIHSLAVLALAFSADTWTTDLGAGLEQARDSGKDVLVYLMQPENRLGMLDDEAIFSAPEFLEPAGREFVLVRQELPMRTPEDPDAQLQRRLHLARRVGFGGSPLAVLLDSDGRAYARLSTLEFEEPSLYLRALSEEGERGRALLGRIDKIERQLRTASVTERRAAAEQAIAIVEELEPETLHLASAAAVLGGVYELDPENEHGLFERALEAVLAKDHHDPATWHAARSRDPKNERGLFERVVLARLVASGGAADELEQATLAVRELEELGFREDAVACTTLRILAMVCYAQGDHEGALAWGEKALAHDPGDDPNVDFLRRILQRLESDG